METSLSEIKTFFDPHPGFAGALVPIPSAVKKEAEELDGKRMSLREAVDKIKATTSGKVKVEEGCILLITKELDGTRHSFRVIRFR